MEEFTSGRQGCWMLPPQYVGPVVYRLIAVTLLTQRPLTPTNPCLNSEEILWLPPPLLSTHIFLWMASNPTELRPWGLSEDVSVQAFDLSWSSLNVSHVAEWCVFCHTVSTGPMLSLTPQRWFSHHLCLQISVHIRNLVITFEFVLKSDKKKLFSS